VVYQPNLKLFNQKPKNATLIAMIDKRQRSLAKTLTWRILATSTTMLLVYLLTKKLDLALGVGIIDIFIKTFIYYAHERLWNKTRWGRKK